MLLDQLGSHKKVTKELEKQEKVIFNIFESDRQLINANKKKATIEEEVLESIKKQNEQFSISSEIVNVIKQGV